MGDFLKDNPILSHLIQILITLLLIFMAFAMIGKPWVKAQDEEISKDLIETMDQIIKNDSLILETLKNYNE